MFAKINLSLGTGAFVSLMLFLVAAPHVPAADEFGKRATWNPPTAAEVKARLDEWLKTKEVDETTQLKIDALWPETGGPTDSSELLEQLGTTIALIESAARELVTFCRNERTSPDVPDFAILKDETAAPLVRSNLRLLFARWLAQNDLYDESLEQVSDMTPDEVVDPASLLFYQSVGYHRLLDKEKCLPTIEKLLEREASLPRRYSAMAHLMEADLRPLKTDSLDEVARLMDDIRRRLNLGRAGTVVRKQEDDVIAKLDKMIEEMEKQQQQGSGSGSGNANNPSSPKQDSTPGGASGPGNVDPKKLDRRGDWGDLPQKDRQEALQQISRELPAHYREVIEEYFRKLARDGVK